MIQHILFSVNIYEGIIASWIPNYATLWIKFRPQRIQLDNDGAGGKDGVLFICVFDIASFLLIQIFSTMEEEGEE